MTDAGIRVRFAPSPTGWLHIGNARTALYNWLFARHAGGTMVLRIEDTDAVRSTAESETGILDALRWLGLDWDEGPDVGGGHGPYRQTERLDIYRRHADRLLESGRAYHCFCPPDGLERERETALADGRAPRYSGRCARLSREEAAARLAREPAAVRFRVPEEEIVVDDLIRGRVTFPPGEIGDFVILRSNGLPSYNFAVVVDDNTMGMTHVIRGEDHLSNTPKQIFLYRALGMAPPRFAHLSMILGPDGARLSKRHGATSVSQFRDMGYLPEALTNYLALLGWSPGDDREVMSREELASLFSLDRVSKSASIFDPGKLSWMNGVYLRAAGAERLAGLARPFLEKEGLFGLPGAESLTGRLPAYIEVVKGYAHFLADFGGLIRPYLSASADYGEEARAALREPGVAPLLTAVASAIEACPPASKEEFLSLLKRIGKEMGLSGKKLFMPFRAAVSGAVHGPELDRVYLLIGPARAVGRLREAVVIAAGRGAAG